MDFKLIELTDKPVFDQAFSRQYYENSWFTFTNLYVWRDNYSTAWAIDDESLVIPLCSSCFERIDSHYQIFKFKHSYINGV